MMARKLAYRYLLLWSILAAAFTLAVDMSARKYRTAQLYEMSENYQADMLRLAYGIVTEAGPDALHPNQSQELHTLDIYLADNDQQAKTKPRFSHVGTTITNKSIIRALEVTPGEVETWISPADYRGTPVIAAYTSIDVDGERLALICEVDQEEVVGRVEVWWFFSDVLWIAFFAAMAVALTKSSATRLASAAQAITINVEGGKGGSGGTAAGAVTNNGGNNTLTGDVQ